MQSIKKIICPLDIYKMHPAVAEYAVSLATLLGVGISVVYVLEPIPAAISQAIDVFDEKNFEQSRITNAEARMSKIMAELFQANRDEGLVIQGDPAEEIINIAEKLAGGMIIMGSFCHTLTCRIMHGSVSSKVLSASKIPVLAIPSE